MAHDGDDGAAATQKPRWLSHMLPLRAMEESTVPFCAVDGDGGGGAGCSDGGVIEAGPDVTEILRGRLYVCALLGGELYRSVRAHVPPGRRFTVISMIRAEDLMSRAVGIGGLLCGPLYTQTASAAKLAAAGDTNAGGSGLFVDTDAAERYAVWHFTGGGTTAGTGSLLATLLELNTGRSRGDFTLIHVSLDDRNVAASATLRERLPDLVRAVDNAIVLRGEPVFIHCQIGVSRSATLAVAYVLARAAASLEMARAHDANMRLDTRAALHTAIAYVRARRTFVQPWDGSDGGAAARGGFVGVLRDLAERDTWHRELIVPMARAHTAPGAVTKADAEDGIEAAFVDCVRNVPSFGGSGGGGGGGGGGAAFM